MNALQTVAANEDSTGPKCAGTVFGEVTFTATAGQTYRIAVDTSGGLTGTSDPPQGAIQLSLKPPVDPDDAFNPGTPVDEADTALTFSMPRFIARCKGTPTPADEPCPDKTKRFAFKRLTTIQKVVAGFQAQGANLTLEAVPVGSKGAVTDNQRKSLLKSTVGGQVLTQSIKPKAPVTTSINRPVSLKVTYFDPAEDRKVIEQIKDDNKKEDGPKSKCEPVSNTWSETYVNEVFSGQPLDQAVKLATKHGCGAQTIKEVPCTCTGTDYVFNVSVNKAKDRIEWSWFRPRNQDFLFTIRDAPTFENLSLAGIGADGFLTAGVETRFTIQVIERATGRLVQGVLVKVYLDKGEFLFGHTNAFGEVTGIARFKAAGVPYTVEAELNTPTGLMKGYRELRAVNRNGQPYTTLSGRRLQFANGQYHGSQADALDALALPVAPASIGTGVIKSPLSALKIEQGTALVQTASGQWLRGQQNIVTIPDDSSFLVGAGPGLVAINGGTTGATARPAAPGQRFLGDWLAGAGRVLNGIVTGLKWASEQNKGSVNKVLTAPEKEAIAKTATKLTSEGAPPPSSSLISDKGLGLLAETVNAAGAKIEVIEGAKLISYDGSGPLGDQGAGIVNGAGLSVAGGPLIGQAGGN